jgi:hypothetical protein
MVRIRRGGWPAAYRFLLGYGRDGTTSTPDQLANT